MAIMVEPEVMVRTMPTFTVVRFCAAATPVAAASVSAANVARAMTFISSPPFVDLMTHRLLPFVIGQAGPSSFGCDRVRGHPAWVFHCALAADAPAIRPNTAADIRPEPPG